LSTGFSCDNIKGWAHLEIETFTSPISLSVKFIISFQGMDVR